MNTTLLITGAIAFAGALLLACWRIGRSAVIRNPDRQTVPPSNDRVSSVELFYDASALGR